MIIDWCVIVALFDNTAGPSTSPIYTIGVNSNGTPSNYTNAAYVITENPKASQSNDGLPSYEEAMTGIRTSMSQCSVSQSTTIPIEAPAEEVVPISSKRGRKHRHRHHQRHNRRPRTDASANQPTEHSPCATYSAICESRGNAMGDEATRGRHGRSGRIFRNQRRHHRHNHHQNQQE